MHTLLALTIHYLYTTLLELVYIYINIRASSSSSSSRAKRIKCEMREMRDKESPNESQIEYPLRILYQFYELVL